MAASAFVLYNEAKKYMVNGTIDLDTNVLKLQLHTSASNAETSTLSTLASVSNQAAGGGYAAKTLGNVVVTVITSATIKFDASDLIFTASASSLVGWKYAVIGVSGGKAICWSKLTTAQQTLTTGNTLTIQFATNGIFTIV